MKGEHMKVIVMAVAALVVAPMVVGPDFAKLLKDAKSNLSEAIDLGLKEAKDGTVVKAEIEEENGKIIWTMDIAQGDKIREVGLTVSDNKVVENAEEKEDQSALVKAFKITATKAIAAALKKCDGKAVCIELKLEKEKPVAEVKIFKDGACKNVIVNGETGEVVKVEEPKAKSGTGMGKDEEKDEEDDE